MIPDIVRKLSALIEKGITTEAEVVYLMAQIRKLLEANTSVQYQYLKFYCDWALHPKLDRNPTAIKILDHFDQANMQLKAGIELHTLPTPLRNDIDNISKMNFFKEELHNFLLEHSLQAVDISPDGWTKFLLLYAKVIEDCTLEIKANNTAATIKTVTVKVELANRLDHGQMFYKISWLILDQNGKTGEIFIMNSFAASSIDN